MKSLEDGEITLTPLQLRVIKLRAKGYSIPKIADALRKNQGTVSNALKSFERNYPRALKFIDEVKATKYYYKSPASQEMRDLALNAKVRLIEQGYYVGTPPRGYKKEGGKLVIDPEKAPMVQYVFEGAWEGKSTVQMSREILGRFGFKLGPKEVWKMLRRKQYLGHVPFRGNLYRGKHPAIIGRELWESVNPSERTLYHTGRVPFGFIRKGGRFINDPEKAAIVKEMFKDWLAGITLPEMSENFKMHPSTIWRMIKNPIYANKVEVDGKFMDANVGRIIPFETWQVAQRLHTGRPAWDISAKERKKRMNLAVQTLYGMIKRQPANSAELQRITGYKKTKLHRYLRELRARGFIERESGKFGRYYDGKAQSSS